MPSLILLLHQHQGAFKGFVTGNFGLVKALRTKTGLLKECVDALPLLTLVKGVKVRFAYATHHMPTQLKHLAKPGRFKAGIGDDDGLALRGQD